ncbi:MAG TPA: AAA family ATPase, partial [Chloroflexota bacterium]|nr:AAA family ATPase [Chloroflexota bacterium]
MTRQPLPQVTGDCLTLVHPQDGTQTRLRVGSAEWHAWLADKATTSFSCDAEGLTLTVRRERQRHGRYWYAYRKHEGRLRKAYLGRGEDLTATTLRLAAQTLGRQTGEPAVAPLQLRVLGTPWFGRRDQPLAPPTAKVAALLAYLAVTGIPQARDGILALLWPESATAAARKNLRNSLWAIRAGVGTDVLSEGTHLALGAGVWTDVQDFERHIAAGDHQRGLALYRGPFLDGLVLDEVPEFELWLTTQRARLEQTYLRAAGAHVALLGTQGDWQQALAVATAALAHDPLQEPLWRALMEGHARLGQRAEALRAYEILCTTLERELRLAPLAATDALREAIARGDLAPVAATPAATATPAAAPDCPRAHRVHPRVLRGPFLGRGRELASLDASLGTARPGRARVVLLSGDAGIGKSRLWQEWSRCLGDDVRVMETRCLEVTQPLPYAPLLSFFDQAHVEQRMPHPSPGTPAWLAEIWRLHPAVTQQRSAPAAAEPQAAGDERHRVLEAFVQCFLALSSQPLVVCLDDVHWADSATLDCLGYLVHRLHDRPLMLVLAFRPAEAPAAFVRLCSTWWQQGLLLQVQVAPLEIAEVGALVEALGGERTRVEALYAQGGGNPLLIAELLRAAPGNVPPLLAGLIAARLDRLPAEARRLLQAAAIVEPDGDFATLCRTAGSDEDATLDALDLLLQAGILVEREQVYRFAIPLFAEEVRRGLSGARRASLHRRAAAAIADRYAGRATHVAGRLARHYAEAGEQWRHVARRGTEQLGDQQGIASALRIQRLDARPLATERLDQRPNLGD